MHRMGDDNSYCGSDYNLDACAGRQHCSVLVGPTSSGSILGRFG